MRYLVTGAAGFVGFFLAKRLLENGHEVVGIDNLNDYYDPKLKVARLKELKPFKNFEFQKIGIENQKKIEKLFKEEKFDRVLHMAAQAGVRYSLENPQAYVDSNLTGFVNILEGCRHQKVPHLIYASSSSVYGGNVKMPFSVHDSVDHPVSLYAATKKANELMAHSYAYLYKLPCTGLRFFTVYGPWGRPDMAYFKFTQAILKGRPIEVFNHGRMKRDFTYVDDVVEGVLRVSDKIPASNPTWDRVHPDPGSSFAPARVYNIGNHQSVELLRMIELLEKFLNKKAKRKLLPMQPGDVVETFADISDLGEAVGFKPSTPIEVGLKKFVEWYLSFYKRK
jgi:UDP-glucuronate 4-epimerase